MVNFKKHIGLNSGFNSTFARRSSGFAPSNTVAPEITGILEVGETLTCSTGTWTGTPTITYSYQWKRGVTNIGTDSNTYVSVLADVGENITCTVTATNVYGSASQVSNGVVITKLLPDMLHEYLFLNVQNPSGNIITIPDTGTVGGLDLSNPALTNKPTASTIGTKISYSFDGVDDYLYKSENQFMRSFPTFMVTTVFKHNNSGTVRLLSCFNESNINPEGWSLITTPIGVSIQTFNSLGASTFPIVWSTTLINGDNYILTFAWNGTNRLIYQDTTVRGNAVGSNPLSVPTTTKNISTMSSIRGLAGSVFTRGNIAYIGIDEYNLARLNNNVATLKNFFGI